MSIKSKILSLLDERGATETICPSEVARALFPKDWREHMDSVRSVAIKMNKENLIDITQKGEKVKPPFKGPIRLRLVIDYRKFPQLYRVQKGEQGVLSFEPYKSELLPFWRFKTPDIAKKSSEDLTKKFYEFLEEEDFVGMDMARKFIQMGYTRARRYANHKCGKKYDHGEILPLEADEQKAKSAEIFKNAWDEIEKNDRYREMKEEWKLWYG